MTVESVYNERQMTDEYRERMSRHFDELKWLYFELYHQQDGYFVELCNILLDNYNGRELELKQMDRQRTAASDWYKKQNFIGMTLYIDSFADNISGVIKHIDYIKRCNVNYINIMPPYESAEKNDGGYAISDYHKIKKELGTMDDLKKLIQELHQNNMYISLDYVLNHTSDNHEWAQKAKAGDKNYQDRYFFYDNEAIPEEFEKTMPQYFSTEASGNFTYLPNIDKYVMTSFNSFQWDLNYANPVVFNEIVRNMLFLANQGIDILQLGAIHLIWKELGTNCKNMPQAHNILRMLRTIVEIVCPGVLLLGALLDEKEYISYFGTVDKPQCHLINNTELMSTIWHTVATKNVQLIKNYIERVAKTPKEFVFVNMVRSHGPLSWNLDYELLKQWGIEEDAHKRFLNEYFLGYAQESYSAGELHGVNTESGDANFCGRTASMCGIERGILQGNQNLIDEGIRLDIMLHTFLFFQSGIPMIYSGDEIGALNDWLYKQFVFKTEDSRYVQRGKFNWSVIRKIKYKDSIVGRIFHGLTHIEEIRKENDLFHAGADIQVVETANDAVLGLIRSMNGQSMMGLFNLSNQMQTIEIEKSGEQYNLSQEIQELKPYEYILVQNA